MTRLRYFEFNSLLGVIFDQRYKISALLGEGGQAGVFRAWDRQERRSVALKVLRPDSGEGAARFKRFEREAFALMQLDHPNCVRVYASGQDAELGLHYMAMELVQGQPLDLFIRFPMTLRQLLRVARGIAQGLGEAHRRGIVHRDMKPENVLLTPQGRDPLHRPVILDFGIAKFDEEYQMTVLTGSEMVLGTVHYMSPEQAQGQALGTAADIYALGVVLFELVTGQTPFEGTPIQILRHHIATPVPPMHPRACLREIGALEGVIRRCMAKDAAARYPHGDALAEALAEVEATLEHAPLHAAGACFDLDPARGEVLLGFADGACEVRSLESGARRFRVALQPSAPVAVALGPLPGEALSADAEGVLRCFSRQSGALLWESCPLGVPLTALACSPVGGVYAIAGADGRVQVLGASASAPLAELRSHRGPVNRLCFDPTGCTLISAGEDGAVLVWDVGEMELRNRFAVEGSAATAVALHPASGLLAMGSDTGRVTLGHLEGERRPVTFFAHAAEVRGLAFLDRPGDAVDLYSAGLDGELRQWSTQDGASRPWAGLHPEGLRDARWLREGAALVLCDGLLLGWEESFYDELGIVPDRYLSPLNGQGWTWS